MASFKRLRDEIEGTAMQVSAKLPGKTIIWMFISIFVLILLVFGFGISLSSSGSDLCNSSSCNLPSYIFLSNNSESCPALTGEKLLTTLAAGQSFEGLSVLLQCQGRYQPFPTYVRCNRKKLLDGTQVLGWSNLPMCHPSSLVSVEYWKETIHAMSVSCSGNSSHTACSLKCVTPYVAVEEDPYSCDSTPCKAWSISSKKCYMCQSNCTQFHQHHNPTLSDLLQTLSCDPGCDKIVVSSTKGAAVWQNKRTGMFQFVGEHNGRPVYMKNATSEYLYYDNNKTEWLVGPDFTAGRGGIHVGNNEDKSCPERHGGGKSKKMYIDYSGPLIMWREDESIQLMCYKQGQTPVTNCSCGKYQVLYSEHEEKVPPLVKYHTGVFSSMKPDDAFGLLAPVYYNKEKHLYLFSHHPEGLVWQISGSMSTTPLRAVAGGRSCPGSDGLVWEWYNTTGGQGQQLYVRDQHVQVTCMEQ